MTELDITTGTHPARDIAAAALADGAGPLQVQRGILAALVRLGDLLEEEGDTTAVEEELEDQALAVLATAGPDGATDPQFAELLAEHGLTVTRRQRQKMLERWGWGVTTVKRMTPSGLYSYVHATHAAAAE